VYQDQQADGTPYFHACPPLANPGYQPDPLLPRYDPRESIERPGRRNENLVAVHMRQPNGELIVARMDIIAEGAGRREEPSAE
jgi:hypothetical protein